MKTIIMVKKLIIDFNNIGWMSFGICPLTFQNKRIEAIFVGLNMVRSYLVKFEPDICLIAIDGGRDAERMRLYPDYKKRKGELTEVERRERDIFFDQLYKLREVTRALGIVQYCCKGREADDIICSLLGNTESIIVSTDKDFYQLLEKDNVSIYNPVTKGIINAKTVEEKYGIPIRYFVDHKALTGDSSDNLPGVKGIGDKGAEWLINNVFDLAMGIKEANKRQQRMVNLLYDNMDTFSLMRELIRLKRIGREELKEGRMEDRPETIEELQERAIAICEEYGFEQNLRNFPKFILPFEILWNKD